MAADALLPVWVRDLPASFVFQPDGQLHMKISDMAGIGVVKKIIAGPEHCDLLVDIKRPYYRPRPPEPLSAIADSGEGETLDLAKA